MYIMGLVLFLGLGMIVTSALIIWKALICVTGSESPVVVVLSESMEPGFQRVSHIMFYSLHLIMWLLVIDFEANVTQGDILFLRMTDEPIRAGEIVVFSVDVSVSLVLFHQFTIFLRFSWFNLS